MQFAERWLIIYANHHVRLLPTEPLVVEANGFLPWLRPRILDLLHNVVLITQLRELQTLAHLPSSSLNESPAFLRRILNIRETVNFFWMWSRKMRPTAAPPWYCHTLDI
jgi:hypothetical protein